MKTASERAAAYLAKLPAAIDGQGGHNSTLRAACELARFGLGDGEALAVLAAWNRTHCQLLWTERELAHKWQSARAKVQTASRLVASRPAVRVVWNVTPRTRPQPPATPPQPSAEFRAEVRGIIAESRPVQAKPFAGQALANYLNQRPSIPKDCILRG